LIAAVAFIVGGSLWWQAIHTLHRVVKAPTRLVPSPNAWDYFRQAGASLSKSDAVSEQAFAFSAQKASPLVAMNGPAFKLVKQGLRYEYLRPETGSQSKDFAMFSSLTRLLVLRARVREAKGDWSGAMGDRLDAMEMGAKIQHGEALMGFLVGVGKQTIARRRSLALVDHLNSRDAFSAARRMADIDASQTPCVVSLQLDKFQTQKTIASMFSHDNPVGVAKSIVYAERQGLLMANKLGEMFGPNGHIAAIPSARESSWRLIWIAMEPYDKAMDSYTSYVDACITAAKMPYQQGVRAPITKPTDPIGTFLVNESLPKARTRQAINDCGNRILELQLALRAYHLDHRQYPDSLSKLTPECLPRVPDDPFADPAPFHYRRAATGFVLYSVGPDGVDNHGTPIVDSSRNKLTRYSVRGGETGDFVAGINY
jgi:hypothetical protein